MCVVCRGQSDPRPNIPEFLTPGLAGIPLVPHQAVLLTVASHHRQGATHGNAWARSKELLEGSRENGSGNHSKSMEITGNHWKFRGKPREVANHGLHCLKTMMGYDQHFSWVHFSTSHLQLAK